jgi:hypothetical protein
VTTPDDPDDPDAWRQRAACRDHPPDWWFPDPKDVLTRDLAVRICDTCPVAKDCRAEAKKVRATYGVWAGRFIDKLGTFRSDAPRRVKPHGTLVAHRRHARHGEAPCTACKAAWNAYQPTKPSMEAKR